MSKKSKKHSPTIDDFVSGQPEAQLMEIQSVSAKYDWLTKRGDVPKGDTPWWVTRDMAEEFGREAVLATTLKAAVFYCIYFLSVTMCTLSRRHEMMFYFAQGLRNQFVEKDFRTKNNVGINFAEIKSVSDFWQYAQTLLLDGLYWNYYYKDKKFPIEDPDDKRRILYENYLLGVPRIRMVKVRNDSCSTHEYFRLLFKGCYDMFSPKGESRIKYAGGNGTAWVYNDASKTGSIPFRGRYATYDGGGYYQDLSSDRDKTLALIRSLHHNLWITRGTRAVFIDFTIYNANMNLFCLCKLVFEFPPTGGVYTWNQFTVAFLDIGFNSQYKTMFFFECMIYVMGVFYIFEEIREMWFFRLAYFLQFWAYMDLTLIALIIANLVTSVILFPNVYTIIDNIIEHMDQYPNMEYVGCLKNENNKACAILLFFSFIKFFKYLNLNRTTGQLNNTLKRCVNDIFCFTIMFMIIFSAYAALGYLLFGSQAPDFSTFGDAMLSLLRTILGDFEYKAIEHANSFIAPIYFLSFIFLVFFVLLNVFLAIINDTYADVKTEIAIAPSEMSMKDFMRKKSNKYLRKLGFRVGDIQKREAKVTTTNLHRALIHCGFTENEIRKFFETYNSNKRYNNDELVKVIEERANASPKVDDMVLVELADFLKHKSQINRIEKKIQQMIQQLDEPLKRLEELEKENMEATEDS